MSNYIVIVSHPKYDEALNTLLLSLKGKWDPKNIIIVMNQSPIDKISTHPDEYMIFNTTYNIYEYTAFFVPEAINASSEDAFLLLHDTSYADLHFKYKAEKLFSDMKKQDLDVLWASAHGQCNICVFNYKAANEVTRIFRGNKEIDKMYAIQMEWGNHPHSLKKNKNIKQAFHRIRAICDDKFYQPYTSGHNRKKIYYPSLDIDKYFVHIEKSEDHPQEP